MKAILSVVVSFAVVVLFGTSVSWAQQKSLKEQLVGAWTLVSYETTTKDGKKAQIYGTKPSGILIFDATGRYASLFGRPDRPKLKAIPNLRADAPAAELGEAARGIGANFGTWLVNEKDKTLIRKYELAVIPNNDKNETKTSASLSGEGLTLVGISDTGTKTEMVYRRAK